MKKNAWVFGIIAGLITSLTLVVTFVISSKPDFSNAQFIGYSSMIVAFSFIFVGIKNYRDKYLGGSISFGKAFKLGFYISLIASTVYVVTWVISNHFFIPDFFEKYTEYEMGNMRSHGATEAEISMKQAELAEFGRMYSNPLANFLLTYIEILPVGLLISLIAALILKRKPAAASNTVVQ
jgi:hypothetical protein